MGGRGNYIALDNTKDKTITFTRIRRPDLKRKIEETMIIVCGHTIVFNMKATRWLVVHLYSRLQYKAHKNLTLEKARRTEDRVRRLATARGLMQRLVRKIQVVAVQAITLYSADVWWNGQKGWCEEYQRHINRYGMTVTRMVRSASKGVVISEASLPPALSLLNNRE